MSASTGLAGPGKTLDIEYRMADRHGRIHWIHDKAVIVGSEDGRTFHVQGILLDMSEQKRSEEDRRTLSSLVENSADCIAVASMDRRIQYVNGAGLEMLGISCLEEAQRLLLEDFVTGEELARVLGEILPEVLERGSWRGEISYRNRATGQLIPIRERAFSV